MTTVEINIIERPSALRAALPQVAGVKVRSAVPVAHALVVGQPAVRTVGTGGSPAATDLRYQGITGFTGIQKVQMDGVSGVPPRGRPV